MKRRNLYVGVSAAVLSALMAAPAWAQDASQLEEVVVTARKRAENIQEVPLAIAAFSEEQLERASTTSLRDLAAVTPGLTFQDLNGAYQQPTIRGLGQSDQTSLQGNVGVFLDGVYLSNRSGLEFSLLDIGRIEVIKGPQSALYGRNTFAGAINYVTKAPELGRFGGSVSAEIGTDERQTLQGSLNIPLGEMAAVRLFGGTTEFDGTIKNVRDGKNLGGFEREAYGAALTLEPSDALSVRLYGVQSKVDNEQPALLVYPTILNNCGSTSFRSGVRYQTLYCGTVPAISEVNLDTTTAHGLRGDNTLAYAQVSYDMDFAVLTGTLSYQEAQFRSLVDTTGDPNAINMVGSGVFSQQTFNSTVTDASEETAFDLRIESPEDSPIQWSAGLYYFTSDLSFEIALSRQLLRQPTSVPVIFSSRGGFLSTESLSGYASVGFDLTSRLNLTFEGRYSQEDQGFRGRGADVAAIGSQSFDYVTPRASATYKFDSGLLAYATVARGLKTGGFNSNALGTSYFTFQPETNWSYEAGLKGSLLGGKVIYAADVFYVDADGVQGQIAIPGRTLSVVANEGGVSSRGVELDATWYAAPSLWFRFAGAVVDPTYKDGFIDGDLASPCGDFAGSTIAVVGCSDQVGGKQLARTSKYQAALTANYTLPTIVEGYEAFIQGDYSYQSGKFTSGANTQDQGDLQMFNARLGVSRGPVQFALWGKNLFDRVYVDRVTQVASTNDGGPVSGITYIRIYPGERRTLGAKVSFTF